MLVAPVVFAVGVRPATAPLGAVTVDVKPSGTPAVDAGLKYGSFNAFSISPRNTNTKRPGSSNCFEMPRSRRNSDGPFTVTLRRPQSPYPGADSMQSGPFAGAKYRPDGAPFEP